MMLASAWINWIVSSITVSSLFAVALSIPTLSPHPRPLVLWHGLGDSHSSPGMLQFADLIRGVHPGIFIHSVFIEDDLNKDRRAGFYGNVNEQLALVADQLTAIPELRRGFDAVGFSQGGQFLRAYVERYNTPPIHNLLTFGAQHMGISDIPLCAPTDLLCQLARRATKRAVYSPWVQDNLVQAQYFRDPLNHSAYLARNRFLADVNNELPMRNVTYAVNLASLNKLVLVLFEKDRTVVPRESAWFGSEVASEESNHDQMPFGIASEKTIVPMRLQPLYVEDWIGLRDLDERGGVVFETCAGEHMQIGDCWERLITMFAGGALE